MTSGVVRLSHLSGAGSTANFLRRIRDQIAAGHKSIHIDLTGASHVYPNGIAPMRAIIDAFCEGGITFSFSNATPFVEKTRFMAPPSATKAELAASPVIWNTLWTYTDRAQVFSLSKRVVEDLQQRIAFSRGVLDALLWSLYEVLDNVLEHSRSSRGYFCVQYISGRQELLVSVADAGIGIHRSFITGRGGFRPVLASDALALAVAQWTSSTGEQRGNGLYGLYRIVEQGGGQFSLRSGRGELTLRNGERRAGETERLLVVDKDHHCTVVDFQLKTTTPLDLADVLGVLGSEHRIESLEDDYGAYTIAIKEFAEDVATREGAMRLRVRMLNYLADGAVPLVLDFSGLSVISSSFADETLGRLVEHFGMDAFRQKFRVIGASATVAVLIDRALHARSERPSSR